MTKVLMSIDM